MPTVSHSMGTRNPLADKGRCHSHATAVTDIQKSTSPISLLGLGAGAVPQPITTPHTTTSTIQTSRHPSLYPTFTTPLVTIYKPILDPAYVPTTSPGTSLPTPPPCITTQLTAMNSYYETSTARIQRHTTQPPPQRRAPPHARARIRHRQSANK